MSLSMYINFLLEYKVFIFFILGAITGSVLNVIIIRMPLILDESTNNFNLFYPRSKCMLCNCQIPFWHNIPVLSYILLRGKCFYCKNKFSVNYLLIELLYAISCMIIAFYNDDILIILAKCCFTFFIIAIIILDFKYLIIPDELSITLLWLGLIFNINNLFVEHVKYAIFGAIVGYLFFYILAHIYKLITKKDGIGGGDFKLFSAILAWVGVDMFIPTLLISSFLGILYFCIMKLFKKMRYNQQIPFGPFLSIAGLFILLNHSYTMNVSCFLDLV
jgi:leader peptidase (prepilin peptidase)/N-methyltransferase